MTSLFLPEDSIRRVIARGSADGWVVAAGALTEDRAYYLMRYLATPGIQRGAWATSVFEPAEPDTGYFANAARAIETALGMFRREGRRPYTATVVPADDGPWWFVYLYPTATTPGVWPRGGDVRFRVSADGRVITETRRLHDSITEYSARTARVGSPTLVEEIPVLNDEAPEDTDVFHVLQRRPALPEIMTVGRFRYRIDTDGTIRRLDAR